MATTASAPPPRRGSLTERLRSGFRSPAGQFAIIPLLAALYPLCLLGEEAKVADSLTTTIGLELAGSAEIARRWQGTDPDEIYRALVADFWFIPAYVVVLGCLCLWAASWYRTLTMRKLDILAAGGVALAGLLDAGENALIWLGVRNGYADEGLAALAWPAAAALAWGKFALLGAGVAYVLACATGFTRPCLRRLLITADQDQRPTISGTAAEPDQGERPSQGIALSGGGIRAAAISLGALQTLEGPQQTGDLGWNNAATVTAVSGGAYTGSAFSIARTPHATPPAEQAEPAAAPVDPGLPAWARGSRDGQPVLSPEERHLRSNLGYLLSTTPRGSADDPFTTSSEAAGEVSRHGARIPSVYATLLTGLVVNLIALLVPLWLVTKPIGWFYHWFIALEGRCSWEQIRAGAPQATNCLQLDGRNLTIPLIWVVAGAVLLFAWVLAAKGLEALQGEPSVLLLPVKYLARAALAIGVILLVLLVVIPFLMSVVHDLLGARSNLAATLTALGGVAGAVASASRVLAKPAARFAPVLGGVVFFFLVLFLAVFWSFRATWYGVGGGQTNDPGLWFAVLVLAILGNLATSSEWWSMAPFYRSKLRQAFATYRQGGRAVAYENGNGQRSEPSLFAYPQRHGGRSGKNPAWRGTPLRLCASATVSGRTVDTHYGIPAVSVTFDPERVRVFVPRDDEGAWGEYSCSTRAIEQVRHRYSSRMTTMRACGMSGAAVAPAMGRFKVGPTSMLLTFANVRLGSWIPNPRYVDRMTEIGGRWPVRPPMPRLGYLLKEFIGFHDPTDLYLYVTDGGHWENTGLVELLRTAHHDELICIDADSGKASAVRSIAQAIDLAALECAAQITMNLDPLRGDPDALPGQQYAQRSVALGIVERHDHEERRVSMLWYCKPALTPDMPPHLLAHRETNPSFPRVTTLDQFFDTAQFVAYRGLGEYNARVIRDARTALIGELQTHPTYGDFRATALQSGAHWVLRELVALIEHVVTSDVSNEVLYDDIREVYGLAR